MLMLFFFNFRLLCGFVSATNFVTYRPGDQFALSGKMSLVRFPARNWLNIQFMCVLVPFHWRSKKGVLKKKTKQRKGPFNSSEQHVERREPLLPFSIGLFPFDFEWKNAQRAKLKPNHRTLWLSSSVSDVDQPRVVKVSATPERSSSPISRMNLFQFWFPSPCFGSPKCMCVCCAFVRMSEFFIFYCFLSKKIGFSCSFDIRATVTAIVLFATMRWSCCVHFPANFVIVHPEWNHSTIAVMGKYVPSLPRNVAAAATPTRISFLLSKAIKRTLSSICFGFGVRRVEHNSLLFYNKKYGFYSGRNRTL